MLRIVAIAVLASCSVSRPTFECSTWENCGPGGACEPGTASCSFPDPSCLATGRRFSSLAAEPYRDSCVEYAVDAPAGAVCDANAPTCAEFRGCLGGRCVSTAELDSGTHLTCGRCALAPNEIGPLFCWGKTAILSPFAPVLLTVPGHACPNPGYCPQECAGCPATCPDSCTFGSDITSSFTVGENHLCFYNGRLYCAGRHDSLQLGEGAPRLDTPTGAFQTVRLDATFSVIAAGANHTCGRPPFSDSVHCWGANHAGQLSPTLPAGGPQLSPTRHAPFPTPPGQPVVGVELLAASADFSCATTTSEINCWGAVPWGAGLVQGLPPGQLTDFDVGVGHACAIKGGRAVCWGNNRWGQANPAAPDLLAPPTVVLENATRVVTGRAHTCAIDGDGAVWCWGFDDKDQLDGNASPGPALIRARPPAVGPMAAGADFTCAVHADDRVRCWGDVLQVDTQTFRDFTICER